VPHVHRNSSARNKLIQPSCDIIYQKRIPQSEGVRSDRWKYIRYTEPNPLLEQLFDLSADPHEERDLAPNPNHTSTLSKLRNRCDDYRQSLQ